MEKITEKAMYESIIALVTTGEMSFDKDTYIEFCQKKIGQLDKRSERAKETAAKKRAEEDVLTTAVREVLSTEEFEPIADIAARIEGEDVTVSKIAYRLTQLIKNGKAEKQEISVSGGEGQKSKKVMGYRLIAQ